MFECVSERLRMRDESITEGSREGERERRRRRRHGEIHLLSIRTLPVPKASNS